MQTAQTLELLVPERLDTETQTIDAGLAKTGELFERDGLGIGLEGDFSVRCKGKAASARFDNRADLVRLEQRRRAATEENRIGGVAIGPAADLLVQRGDVLGLQFGVKESPIEVAVVADGRAERNVDVEAQSGHVRPCYDPARPPDHFR